MSKGSKIRWRTEDKKKVANAVRTFNSKLTRTLKKHPELAEYLPSRITTEEVRNKIGSRADFNREINSLKRFMEKGAEAPILSQTGIKTTKWEKKEVGIKIATINRARTRERKKADVSTYKGTMGSIKENNLLPKAYNIDKIKKTDWGKFVELAEKQVMSSYTSEKKERYKQNYLKAMYNVFGEMGEELLERVRKIDPETLVQMFYDNPILQIDFVYDPQEAMFLMEAIEEHLEDEGY